MASGYPAALDTFATNKQDDIDAKSGRQERPRPDDDDRRHAQHHNDLADAINKIEAELGTLAKGIYAASVRERFEIAAFKNQSVKMATTANLAATYANGTAGVGATLTATANGVMAAIDGITPVATTPPQRVLVKNQTAPAQNGIYTVTSRGCGGSAVGPHARHRRRHVSEDRRRPRARRPGHVRAAGHPVGLRHDRSDDGHDGDLLAADHAVLRARQPAQSVGAWTQRRPGRRSWRRCRSTPALGQWTVAPAAPQQWLIGGLVAPAGRTVTNINYFALVAGAAPTVSWFALARQSDRRGRTGPHREHRHRAEHHGDHDARARHAMDADRGHAGLARHELRQRDDGDDPARRRGGGSEPRRAEPHRTRALRYQRRHTDHDGPDRRHDGHHRRDGRAWSTSATVGFPYFWLT
jgi:hypothetical protein